MELDTLSDADLQKLYVDVGELIAKRKKEQQQIVIEEARNALAAVGLTLRDLARAPRSGSKPKRAAAAPEGQTLINPDDPSQTWKPGRGRPPKWAKKLQEKAAEGPASDRKRA